MIYQQLIDRAAKWMFGNSVIDSFIAEKSRLGLRDIRKISLRSRMLNKEFNAGKMCLENRYGDCLKSSSLVTLPVALISQIQRSGGSLLSQLFDGHPQIHAHPYELKIGYPKKNSWPKIDLNDRPEQWFEVLFEDNVIKDCKEGYKKSTNYDRTFPFTFLPGLQKQIFLQYIDSCPTVRLRDVFDAYMTSYFSAWTNNTNKKGDKKYVTAFTPRLTMSAHSTGTFFQIYPDGRLISIARDPKNWFPSALRHNTKKKKYEDIATALEQWKRSANAMVRNKRKYGDRACILRFEDLINDTESVVRYLATFLGIDFDDTLLTPTFNRSPIKANTSFQLEEHGIMASTLSRFTTLGKEELQIINKLTSESYHAVLKEAVEF